MGLQGWSCADIVSSSVQMNQIRDALDDGGALSSGSRRDALTSFSQRHLHGQALSAFLHTCNTHVAAHPCMLATVRTLKLTVLQMGSQGIPLMQRTLMSSAKQGG